MTIMISPTTWFKKCFFCKGKKDLATICQPGYHTYYYHYHPECVRQILNDPEGHERYVDTAIQIMDKIESKILSDRDEHLRRMRRVQEAQTKLRSLDDQMSLIDEQNRTDSPLSNNNLQGELND